MSDWSTTIFTREFLVGTGERALKTFAQVLLGFVAIGGIGMTDVNWADALDVAAAATVASVLTSVATPRQASYNPEPSGKHVATA